MWPSFSAHLVVFLAIIDRLLGFNFLLSVLITTNLADKSFIKMFL